MHAKVRGDKVLSRARIIQALTLEFKSVFKNITVANQSRADVRTATNGKQFAGKLQRCICGQSESSFNHPYSRTCD